jgi:hypothetical protein
MVNKGTAPEHLADPAILARESGVVERRYVDGCDVRYVMRRDDGTDAVFDECEVRILDMDAYRFRVKEHNDSGAYLKSEA